MNKQLVKQIVRLLAPHHLSYNDTKSLFRAVRLGLEIADSGPKLRRLPDILTDLEMVTLFDTIWKSERWQNVVMLRLLLYTGVRVAELCKIKLKDVDLEGLSVRIEQGKGGKDRVVPLPERFKGELGIWMNNQKNASAKYLFESNRHRAFSPRRIRQILTYYAKAAGITKRVYPHLFRHQAITYLAKAGMTTERLQVISGHSEEKSLAIYRDLSLADVADQYQKAMKDHPVK